ncbi:MAG TPA: hypothetical protein VHS28_00895 [Chloroflexota bacterium]|nr:hypothetical protein [Chloroflexota bacterium]
MGLYLQLLPFIKEIAPTWLKTQLTNLVLLASALFQQRSLVLTELARAYPIPAVRKVARPSYGLLHRVRRLGSFFADPRLDDPALMLMLTRLSYSVSAVRGCFYPFCWI